MLEEDVQNTARGEHFSKLHLRRFFYKMNERCITIKPKAKKEKDAKPGEHFSKPNFWRFFYKMNERCITIKPKAIEEKCD
ncbi:MAG: hypothetical protein IPL31_15815 [Saprospiraceae bacterium]|nr:hypothetical protein [Saprospiraceae bacterium]